MKIEVGDLVIYSPEFHGPGDRDKYRLYELVELQGDIATIRDGKDPSNVKKVPVDHLELSFSMNGNNEGWP